jgi:hypothetical protein
MDTKTSYLRQAFLIIMFFMALQLLLASGAFYFGMDRIFSNVTIAGKMNKGPQELIDKINRVITLQQNLRMYFYPVSVAIFTLTGLLLWFFLKLSFLKNIKITQFNEKEAPISMDSEKKNNTEETL